MQLKAQNMADQTPEVVKNTMYKQFSGQHIQQLLNQTAKLPWWLLGPIKHHTRVAADVFGKMRFKRFIHD